MCQWVQVSTGMGNLSVYSLANNGNIIFAGTQLGVYKSTDNGSSWNSTPLNNRSVLSLAVNGNNIFAGTGGNYGIYLSTNNGTSWVQTSLNSQVVHALLVSGNNIFAGTVLYGLYLSTNNGTTWTQTSLNNRNVESLAINGNDIFAGTASYGVYLSTNTGVSWTQTSLGQFQTIWSLGANGNNIFAGTDGLGVYLSTNSGANWIQTLTNQWVLSLGISGNNIFAGTDNAGGLFVSNNNGANWMQRNEGIGTLRVYGFSILNNYIFAGSAGNSVYRRPLSEVIGIQKISNELPNQFLLYQNYPNPFNPTTKIKFELPKSSFTTIKLYNILGSEAATLVNEQLQPGTYEVDWNATDYPSGIYYYKITAGDYKETKKMVLVK